MKSTTKIILTGLIACITTTVSALTSTNQVLTIEALREYTNRTETANVMVVVMPITDYVIHSSSQTNIQVYFDAEIKVIKASSLTTNNHGQVVSVRPVVGFIGATFNNNISMYLDARTNDTFAIYYWDLEDKNLIRLEQEHYDSLLEAIINRKAKMNAGGFNSPLFADPSNPLELLPATPYIYVVIDGNRIDPGRTWFGSWNNTIEAHAIRLHPWGELETDHLGKTPWVPLEYFWFEKVPDFLKIDTDPSKYWPNERENGRDVLHRRSAFWRIMGAMKKNK